MNLRPPTQEELARLAPPGVYLRPCPVIRGVNRFDIEERRQNIRHAFSLGLPNLHELINAERGKEAAIIGGGPSVDAYIFAIARKQKDGARIIAIERMLPWCLKQGIYPDYVVTMDAAADVVEAFQDICSKPVYLIATQCRPEVFERLRGLKTYIYSTTQQDLRAEFYDYERGVNDCEINSAGSVVLASMSIAMVLGMETLNVYGFDCHITNGSYASGIAGRGGQDSFITVRVGERDFKTTYPYLLFARQFFLLKKFGEDDGLLSSVKVYGDSLVTALAKEDIRGC